MEECAPSQPGDPDQAADLAGQQEEKLPSVLGDEHTDQTEQGTAGN